MSTAVETGIKSVGEAVAPDGVRRASFAVIVDNEPGVLHRVVGLFSARGYNIESLAVAATDRGALTSRITIVTSGSPQVLAQIRAQLAKMISAREVFVVSDDPRSAERQPPPVRVMSKGDAL